jgi:hypothetical protein
MPQTHAIRAVRWRATAPPIDARGARLVQKQRAGASLAVLNHVSSTTVLSAFMDDARAAGLYIPVLAAVVVFTDYVSAAVLQGPGWTWTPRWSTRLSTRPTRSKPGSSRRYRRPGS